MSFNRGKHRGIVVSAWTVKVKMQSLTPKVSFSTHELNVWVSIMGGREKALTEKGTDDRVNVVRSTQRYLIFSNSSSRDSG